VTDRAPKRGSRHETIVTTASEVEGRTIADYLGVVRGIVVRVPTRRQRIRGLNLRWDPWEEEGRDNPYFFEVAEAARQDAFAAMMAHAESLGADAVIATRYQTTPFAREGVTEVIAYGTAVRLA
jgi:uncharacterized protein YbjQ (UPF0145 family)